MPDGVTISGSSNGGDGSSLQGTQTDDGLTLAGDATLTNLQLGGFAEAISAQQGKQSLRNLFLGQNVTSLVLDGTAQSTLIGSAISLSDHPGVFVLGHAKFTMDGGKIINIGPDCNIDTGIGMNDSSQATLKNGVSLENLQTALSMAANSQATLTDITIHRVLPSDCRADPIVKIGFGSPALTIQRSQIVNSGGTNPIGIQIDATTAASLTLIGTTLRDFKGGIGMLLNSTTKLVVSGDSRITGNKIGIDARGNPNGSVTITNSELSGNNVGITTAILKLRKSRVVGNGTGILVTGINGFALADLGRFGDPGSNTLSGNTLSSLTFGANVIQGGAFASGNGWNPSTQDTDSAGRYAEGRVITGRDPLARGRNFDLPNVNLVIDL